MINKEPILLEENGYKLLDKSVRKNLRKSVGTILSLQLREKVSQSLQLFEKLILSIKPYHEAVEEAKEVRREYGLATEESINESEHFEGFQDGLPPDGLENSIKKEARGEGLTSKFGSLIHMKSSANIGATKQALPSIAMSSKPAGLGKMIFKVEKELIRPEFLEF